MATNSNDPNPALRAEWQAALDILNPQIRGLQNIARNPLSTHATTAVAAELEIRQRRASMLMDAIASLDVVITRRETLAADSYPGMQNIPVGADVFAEIQGIENDQVAASSVFGASAASPQDQATISAADTAVKANTAALGNAMKAPT